MPETKAHLRRRMLLFESIERAFSSIACIGSSQFIYFDAGDPRKCLAPDVFVRVGAANEDFPIWKVWERGAPQLAVEVVSDDDRPDRAWEQKLERYHRMGVEELVRFDAEDPEQPLRVWDRVEGDLLERELETSRVADCGPLGAFWVIVEDRGIGLTLRLARDATGRDLFPTAEEARAESELKRHELEAERNAMNERIEELERARDR